MRRSIGLIIAAIILGLVGAGALIAGRFERRMGIAQEDMAVLDFADPQAEYVSLQNDAAKLPWGSAATLDEIHLRQASLQYWQRSYDQLLEIAQTPPSQDSTERMDPDLMLIAANASFRATQRGPQDKATVLKNLDRTIHAYAESLRGGSERSDAAYNYELAVRLRQDLTAGKRKGVPVGANADETETDPNMHGDPGEPPKDMKVDQFNIRVPMDPKDFRNSQEQNAGTGAARKRRG